MPIGCPGLGHCEGVLVSGSCVCISHGRSPAIPWSSEVQPQCDSESVAQWLPWTQFQNVFGQEHPRTTSQCDGVIASVWEEVYVRLRVQQCVGHLTSGSALIWKWRYSQIMSPVVCSVSLCMRQWVVKGNSASVYPGCNTGSRWRCWRGSNPETRYVLWARTELTGWWRFDPRVWSRWGSVGDGIENEQKRSSGWYS